MTIINKLHNDILEKIQSGTLKQKPKRYFVLMTFLISFGLISLALVLLYLVSFVALLLREHLIFEALSFGPGAVVEIMHTLPILLIVIVATVFLLLHVLVRHFAFAYMKPVVATLGIGVSVVIVTFLGVLVMDKHSVIARIGEGRHVPGIETLHVKWRSQNPPLSLKGYLIERGTSTIMIFENRLGTTTVIITPYTRKDVDGYNPGEIIMVLVKKSSQGLEALAIKAGNSPETRGLYPIR